jgi:hypothetical protein
MQMFCLVKNTVTVIGWLTTPGHSWFGKHELRQIKHLMGDLGHPHIFIKWNICIYIFLKLSIFNFSILICRYF